MEKSSSKNALNVAQIFNIRRQMLPDILCWTVFYGFAIVFATWFCSYDAVSTYDIFFGFFSFNDFSLSVSLMHISLLLTVGIAIFFIKQSISRIVLQISLPICVILMMISIFIVGIKTNIYLSIFIGILLGLSATALFIRFSGVFNNTERFYSVIFGNIFMVLIAGFSLIYKRTSTEFLILCTVCAFLCSVFSYFLKAFLENDDKKQSVPKTLYITIILAIIGAFVCTGTGILIMQKTVTIYAGSQYYFYIGCLVGCAAFFLIYKFFDKALHFSLNATFGATILGVIAYFAGNYGNIELCISAFFIGVSFTMGMMSVYYTSGLIINKFSGRKYMKLFLLAVGVAGGIGGVILNRILSSTLLFALSLVALFVAVFVIVLLLIMSPIISKKFFEKPWLKDAVLKDVNIEEDLKFKDYKLTRRETEVVNLLLSGDTLRQISIKLKISYATVNTYCTSIYRKCGVNSRTELFLLFNK